MTTLLLTNPQRSALATAKRTYGQCLIRIANRWRAYETAEISHAPAIVDQLVVSGLMRRRGKTRVFITAAGYDALEFNCRRAQGRKLPNGARTLKQLAGSDEPVPEITYNTDGSIEFTCAGCGELVFMAVDDGYGFPACTECRWFGEQTRLTRPEVRA